MPEVMDIISKETVHHLHDKFVEGILVLEENRGKSKGLGITTQTFDTAAEPILKYVHQQLMASSTINNSSILSDYPRISKIKVSTILKSDRVADVRLIGDVTRFLQYAGVARFHSKDASWYLRDWAFANVAYIGTSAWASIRPDHRVEKRIEEEKDTPVTSSYNLRGFTPPGSDPKAILSFIEKFIPAALAVQDERDQALLSLQAIATDEEDEWKGIGAKIEDLLSD